MTRIINLATTALFMIAGFVVHEARNDLLYWYIVVFFGIFWIAARVYVRVTHGSWFTNVEPMWAPFYAFFFYVLGLAFKVGSPWLYAIPITILVLWMAWFAKTVMFKDE